MVASSAGLLLWCYTIDRSTPLRKHRNTNYTPYLKLCMLWYVCACVHWCDQPKESKDLGPVFWPLIRIYSWMRETMWKRFKNDKTPDNPILVNEYFGECQKQQPNPTIIRYNVIYGMNVTFIQHRKPTKRRNLYESNRQKYTHENNHRNANTFFFAPYTQFWRVRLAIVRFHCVSFLGVLRFAC